MASCLTGNRFSSGALQVWRRSFWGRRYLRVATAAVAISVAPVALCGQAVLAGTVRADSSGKPLSGADVILVGTSKQTVTDQRGRFLLRDLAPGAHLALFRQPGYRPVRLVLQLLSGDTTWANAVLVPPAVELEPLTVTAEPKSPRGIGVEAFEERRKLGFGNFFDSLDLQRHEQLHLSDLFYRVPGVSVVRPPTKGDHCKHVAISARTQREWPCPMQVVIDGVVVYAATTPTVQPDWSRTVDLDEYLVRGVQAVEIYRGGGARRIWWGRSRLWRDSDLD
jgi:Carboxypeptidase regulatory-like domain